VTSRQTSALFVGAWALYISIVTASNVTELLHSLGIWSPLFRSGNVGFIAVATKIYWDSTALNQLLLAGVILWEGGAAALLWRAAIDLKAARPGAIAASRLGLTVLGLLWFAFAIMTEIFVAFERGVNESQYWGLATATLATLIAIHVLRPDPGN
jgi:hypothetical protein